jgi:uncharacterized protein (TIGR03085 family)
VSGWSQQQRETVVAALTALGPDAPTACEGWTTADLAAHLYVRERRADAMPGLVARGTLGRHTERVMKSVLRVHPYEHIVSRIADGPPLAMRPFDESINLFEYFVHAEDIRRCNGEGPRTLPLELEKLMWRRLSRMLRLSFRHALSYRQGHGIQLEFITAHGDRTVIGTGPTVRLLAPVSELVLYAFNRKALAEVEVSGDSDAVAALEVAQLGL